MRLLEFLPWPKDLVSVAPEYAALLLPMATTGPAPRFRLTVDSGMGAGIIAMVPDGRGGVRSLKELI